MLEKVEQDDVLLVRGIEVEEGLLGFEVQVQDVRLELGCAAWRRG